MSSGNLAAWPDWGRNLGELCLTLLVLGCVLTLWLVLVERETAPDGRSDDEDVVSVSGPGGCSGGSCECGSEAEVCPLLCPMCGSDCLGLGSGDRVDSAD